MAAILALILFFPLLGATVLALAGRHLPRRAAGMLACLSIAGSLTGAVCGWVLLSTGGSVPLHVNLWNWFAAAGLHASVSILYDPLSAVMATMVSFVALIIHIHSAYFMRDDKSWVRYFCYLNLFVFFMQAIVLADDLVLLFLGWEGVGFCSFALIGFWYTEPERVLAGRKAFLVTRVGDVAFLGALAVLFQAGSELSISGVLAAAPTLASATVTLLGLLLLWAATGKSAQLPLLVWLPDAMAGPSPVSALIHAATMVTSGVYLLIRLFPLLALSPLALQTIAAVGALTALMAACSALAQHDIKRVLAWSTISQVGYMVIGVGTGAPDASFFHLLVHAFFKSLLFMVAGIVIQALHEEHDIFRMGSRVRSALPGAATAFFCGCAALAGLPPFSGFFSKGRILEQAMSMAEQHHGLWTTVWAAGTVTALLTALYSFRVFFLAFTGNPGLEPQTGTAKTPPAMLHVLWPLAGLAVMGGLLDLPSHLATLTGLSGGWLGHVLHGTAGGHPAPHEAAGSTAELLDAALAVFGLVLAWFLYGPQRFARRPAATPVRHFFEQGLLLDHLYMTAVARPYRAGADQLWTQVEDGMVDATALGLGETVLSLARRVRHWGAERLSAYLLWLLLGVVLLLVILAATGIR